MVELLKKANTNQVQNISLIGVLLSEPGSACILTYDLSGKIASQIDLGTTGDNFGPTMPTVSIEWS
jgi:hypothetical protein